MKTKQSAGRPVGICCACWSMDTKRSRYGTYWCAGCALKILGVDFGVKR